MTDGLVEYYRCPNSLVRIAQHGDSRNGNGYFRFGAETCFGQCAGLNPVGSPKESTADSLPGTTSREGTVYLPFDLAEVADNLRTERYLKSSILNSTTASAYYVVRPLLPVAVRKYLQKILLMNWDKLPFPHWPVDTTVDNLFERAMLMALKSQGHDRIPFIWFWPEGASSCAIMTHDVETLAGRNSCSDLMDIDDRFGIKASFQVVPEWRYDVPDSYLDEVRSRSFEVTVQDLNHDGRLFRDRNTFLERIPKINAYGRKWGAHGFRAAVLYRRQEWFKELEFSYDMSVPNVAHLDPQRGGCCTVMPYFVGDILELPVTATQDYSLFHILNDYSIDLWTRQVDLIMAKHGLISFIVHPDYIMDPRPRRTYETLLAYLAQLRSERNVWIPTPGEVDRWWRQRAQMQLVPDGDHWRIEGSGSERARIAYASEEDGRLVLSLQEAGGELASSNVPK